MADQFQIIPYKVRSAGTDVPPEEIQTAINSLASQTQIALNAIVGTPEPPSGPAGGDLSGTYPNPTVSAVHATSGTESGVAVTGNTINSSPIGQTTPAAGAFTTLTATTPVAPTSGGTGLNALTAHAVVIGEGSSNVGFASPGATAQALVSNGVAADPSFQTLPVAGGGTGQASLLAHGVMIGEGTAAIHTTAGTTGQMLIGVTGADPAFGNAPTITGGTINSTPIGATTPSTGAFTTITATGTITPSSTNGIVGTTTNDNANAGSVGEHVNTSFSSVAMTNNTNTNLGSISLTAGDWEVQAFSEYLAAGTTTWTAAVTSISSTSATLPTVGFYNQQTLQFSASTAPAWGQQAPTQRFSLASTTTLFCVSLLLFTAGTITATGYIRARRVR